MHSRKYSIASSSLLKRCLDLGFRLREVSLPRPADILPTHATIFACSRCLLIWRNSRPTRTGFPQAQNTFRHLRGLRAQDYVIADRRRTIVRRNVEDFSTQSTSSSRRRFRWSRRVQRRKGICSEATGRISPTLSCATPRCSITAVTPYFVYLIRRSPEAASVGIQIIGRLDADADVLKFGAELDASLTLNVKFRGWIRYYAALRAGGAVHSPFLEFNGLGNSGKTEHRSK